MHSIFTMIQNFYISNLIKNSASEFFKGRYSSFFKTKHKFIQNRFSSFRVDSLESFELFFTSYWVFLFTNLFQKSSDVSVSYTAASYVVGRAIWICTHVDAVKHASALLAAETISSLAGLNQPNYFINLYTCTLITMGLNKFQQCFTKIFSRSLYTRIEFAVSYVIRVSCSTWNNMERADAKPPRFRSQKM